MVVITHIVNKRPIMESTLTRLYMRRKGELGRNGLPVKNDYIDGDYEKVERHPSGWFLFKVVETVGSSAVKKVRYFRYLGDLMGFLEKYVSISKDSFIPYEKYQELGLVLSDLRAGNYTKVIFNRNVTWEARE